MNKIKIVAFLLLVFHPLLRNRAEIFPGDNEIKIARNCMANPKFHGHYDGQQKKFLKLYPGSNMPKPISSRIHKTCSYSYIYGPKLTI